MQRPLSSRLWLIVSGSVLAALVFAVSGCALSLAPTPTPTLAPAAAGGAPPLATPSPITAFFMIVLPSETPTAAAPVGTPPPPAKGRVKVTYPDPIKVEEAGIVILEISDIPALASLTGGGEPSSGVIDIQFKSQTHTSATVEDTLKLDPVMSAELGAPNFEVTKSDLDPRRQLAGLESALWTWHLVPKKAGLQTITINVYGHSDLGSNPLTLVKSITREIQVLDKSWNERLADWLGTNLFIVIGSGGPLGLVLAWLAYKASQNSNRPKSA